MKPEDAKRRCDDFYQESVEFHHQAREFDVPWSVPYEFSAYADDVMWDEYGKIEEFWANEDSR